MADATTPAVVAVAVSVLSPAPVGWLLPPVLRRLKPTTQTRSTRNTSSLLHRHIPRRIRNIMAILEVKDSRRASSYSSPRIRISRLREIACLSRRQVRRRPSREMVWMRSWVKLVDWLVIGLVLRWFGTMDGVWIGVVGLVYCLNILTRLWDQFFLEVGLSALLLLYQSARSGSMGMMAARPPYLWLVGFH